MDVCWPGKSMGRNDVTNDCVSDCECIEVDSPDPEPRGGDESTPDGTVGLGPISESGGLKLLGGLF